MKIEKFSDYQDVLLAMMYFTDDMCRKNGVKYTVMDGTLLGAVRDGNIIPWDGDVDIAVTHSEFEKLKTAFKNYKGRYYLCIDVFTIDFLGDDYEAALQTVEEYKRFDSLAERSISFHLPPVRKDKTFAANLRNVLIALFYPFFWMGSKLLTPKFKKKYTRFIKEKISFDEDSKYYTVEPYIGRFGVEENDILKDGYIDLPFSTFKVMAVANYETYLRKTYGDYMTPPPLEKRVPYPSEKELLNCKIKMDDELRLLLNHIKGEENYD